MGCGRPQPEAGVVVVAGWRGGSKWGYSGWGSDLALWGPVLEASEASEALRLLDILVLAEVEWEWTSLSGQDGWIGG